MKFEFLYPPFLSPLPAVPSLLLPSTLKPEAIHGTAQPPGMYSVWTVCILYSTYSIMRYRQGHRPRKKGASRKGHSVKGRDGTYHKLSVSVVYS